MKKSHIVLSWVLRVLVSLGFLLASLGKISSNPGVIKMFEEWGYPAGFHFFIGVVELGLAISLLIPKTMKFAMYGIGIVMVGAMVTHIISDPLLNLIRPLIFMLLTAGIYYLNFRRIGQG